MLQRLSRLARVALVAAPVLAARSAGAQGPLPPYFTPNACIEAAVIPLSVSIFDDVVSRHTGGIVALPPIAALAPTHVRVDLDFFLTPGGPVAFTLSPGPTGLPLAPLPGGLLGAGYDFQDPPPGQPAQFGHWHGIFAQPFVARLTFTDAATGGNVLAVEAIRGVQFANAPEPATLAPTALGLLALRGLARRRCAA